jgi:hypothetical protein
MGQISMIEQTHELQHDSSLYFLCRSSILSLKLALERGTLRQNTIDKELG